MKRTLLILCLLVLPILSGVLVACAPAADAGTDTNATGTTGTTETPKEDGE
ncbi:MAG: hypothetical protein KF824_07430 [Fimbriimonadaceae bacterium]|nr:MAG: hypothetical protein KF824_07430 [Fimbriimonadaceae bacterium]